MKTWKSTGTFNFVKRHKKKYKDRVITHENFVLATNKLDGHIFQSFGKANNSTQFTSTTKALQVYVFNNFSHSSDIEWMLKYMEDFKIPIPSRPMDLDDSIKVVERIKL